MKEGTLYNDRIFMSSKNYVSGYDGALSKYDENARESLSNDVYNYLYLMVIRKSKRLYNTLISYTANTIIWLVDEAY